VVEAKENGLRAEDGVHQARDYAEVLGLKFACATSGRRIIEIDTRPAPSARWTATPRRKSCFRTPDVWPALAEINGGTNARRRRLHPSIFLSYEMPVPPMAKQLELRALYLHAQALKVKHAAIRQANAALLPATLERVFSS
jgi:hypothetical protein